MLFRTNNVTNHKKKYAKKERCKENPRQEPYH